LKDSLHLSVSEVANFRFWVALPIYFSFLFGIARDLCLPKMLTDRGVIVIFGLSSAACYFTLGMVRISYTVLIVGIVCATWCYLFVAGAWHGLISAIGKRHRISGQLSTVWNVAGLAVSVAALFAGGAFSDTLKGSSAAAGVQSLFLLGSLLMIGVAVVGGLSSTAIASAGTTAGQPPSFRDVPRLLTHKPVLAALAIWFLWNFAPGTQTVLQFYLADMHKASGFDWGAFNAIYAYSFLPTVLLFGFLSGRVGPNRLLLLATLIGIPQMLPLLWIDSVQSAMFAAIPIGLMGGMAETAYLALIIRSAPNGLEGTTTMLASSLYMFSGRLGNVLGASIYQEYGFVACAVSAILVYALILPLLPLVPTSPTSSKDDESDARSAERN
jgi:hypothetical protein